MPRRPHRRTSRDLPVGPVAVDTGTAELVVERHAPRRVTLLVNGVPSSHLDLDDPTWLEFEYMQQMALVLDLVRPGPVDAVHIGAAGCALPRHLEATRPGSRQLAVDTDARLLTLVRAWFDLPRAPRLRLRAEDGAETLRSARDDSADVVVRDAFAGDVTPEHLATVDVARDVARVLRAGGLYLANCADRPPLRLVRSEVATLRTVLDVTLLAEPGILKGRRYGNLVLVATPDRPDPRDLAALDRRLRSLAVPVRALRGAELDAFVGSAPVLAAPAAAAGPRTEAAPGEGAASVSRGSSRSSPVRADGPSRPAGPSGPG